ncbi:MAG: discoidin domain-containing protein, partial [Spirochaetia bacterium]|nr:discoidin domain-containing protein [Spirochaetia bacterium]
MKEISIINTTKPQLLSVESEYGLATINNIEFEYDLKKIKLLHNFDIKITLDNDNIFNEITLSKFEKVNFHFINIYSSHDKINWEKITVINIHLNAGKLIISLPLIQAKYINLIINEFTISNDSTKIQGSINYISNPLISTSSNLDRLWVAQNLLEWRNDYGWSSAIHADQKEDIINIDLNHEFYISRIKLKSINENNNYFPVNFLIELSNDKILWNRVISEENYFVSKNNWYEWGFTLYKSRYIRIITIPARVRKNEYVSKILSIDIYAIPQNIIYQAQKNYFSNIYASELFPGLVKLAENNSTLSGVVIQGNDSRLREATTEYHGITQLAKDGESRAGVSVQGNDSRLREATTEYHGITQLAKDGESRAGVSVQGNDSRLREATTEYHGITQLAKDGESRAGVSVQGNDSRLREATTE